MTLPEVFSLAFFSNFFSGICDGLSLLGIDRPIVISARFVTYHPQDLDGARWKGFPENFSWPLLQARNFTL